MPHPVAQVLLAARDLALLRGPSWACLQYEDKEALLAAAYDTVDLEEDDFVTAYGNVYKLVRRPPVRGRES
jgi:hypothetical protein